MVIYLLTTAIVIGMAAMIRNTPESGWTRGKVVNGVLGYGIFTTLFLVSALRLNVGNDYGKYVEFMHLTYSHAYVPTEIGFNLLARTVYTLCGFENFVLVFAIFAFFTILFFLRALWEQSEAFFLSVTLFLLLGYYLQSLSTVRYYLALGIALYSIRFVVKGDWPKFVLLILVGACFHKSLLVVLVLYPLARLTWTKRMMLPVLCLCLSTLFLKQQYLALVVKLYPSYEGTAYLSGGTSAASIVRGLLSLALILMAFLPEKRSAARDTAAWHLSAWRRIQEDTALRFYCNCNWMAVLLYGFCSFLPVISRIGYYLTVTQLLLIPAALVRLKERRYGRLILCAVLILCLGYYAVYLHHAGDDGVRILPYQTFLFHEMPPILSDVGAG